MNDKATEEIKDILLDYGAQYLGQYEGWEGSDIIKVEKRLINYISENCETKELYKKMYDSLKAKNEELRRSCQEQSRRIKEDADRIHSLEMMIEAMKVRQ